MLAEKQTETQFMHAMSNSASLFKVILQICLKKKD